jgi:phage terminase large subunit GpA-like protein
MMDKTELLFRKIANVLAPPPELKVSDWADCYRRLSSEASAEPGQWKTDRAPYQREIMNAVNDQKVETVVVMSSAQVGKSEILLNLLGYYIDYDPSPILFIQPTIEMAQDFSKNRLAPMLRDTPRLKSKVKDAKSKDSNNTLLLKSFPGGYIALGGANSPSGLASRPIRVLLADEVDRYPVSAGTEGDPVNLASKRTTTFWNRKKILVSTPTIKDSSRIEMEYNSSTMEQLNVSCPHCGEYQPYDWAQLIFEHESGTMDFKLKGYVCKECGSISSEMAWKRQPIKWVARHPERINKRGFHLNEMASPWKKWTEIIRDFLEAKRGGKETLKVWTNTSLGLTWEEEGDLDIQDQLLKRREYYNCEVPEDAIVLTAGVDVQDNRLEYEIVGWGIDKCSYGIKYGVIMGDPGQKKVWSDLDDILDKNYIRSDGLEMQVLTTCIDSGGHFTTEVYNYCKKREDKRVWAIKGQGGSGVSYIQRPSKRNKSGAWLFNIGVDVGKDTISSRLKVQFEKEPGFCHFPIEDDRGYDEQYFLGLTSERRNVRYVKGKVSINWEKRSSGARNEPFDIRNYATAALEILNPQLEILQKRYKTEAENKRKSTISEAKTPKKVQKRGSKGVDIWG